MEYIGLDHFNLESFNKEDNRHIEVVKTLSDDELAYEFFYEINYMAYAYEEFKEDNEHNELYIAYYDGVPVGIISLHILKDDYHLGVAILPKMRGINLSSKLLQEFGHYLLYKNPEINNIYIQIHPQNIWCIKNSLKAGFVKEDGHDVLYSLKRK